MKCTTFTLAHQLLTCTADLLPAEADPSAYGTDALPVALATASERSTPVGDSAAVTGHLARFEAPPLTPARDGRGSRARGGWSEATSGASSRPD